MNKLLIICGPTATEKTSLALKLAEKLNGELISADSRQVYKGMDIGTGKDLPVNAKFKYQNTKLGGYYQVGDVRVWGYDLVEPTEEFNVVDYIKIAQRVIDDIWDRGKLPILVGGTGLYIKGVVDGIDTAEVRRNKVLRKSLKDKPANELFQLLTGSDPVKAGSLNESDKKNPRRLIRAIEIAKSAGTSSDKSLKRELIANVLFVGLRTSKSKLDKRIEKRVKQRLEEGLESEIKKLISLGVTWEMQSMQALGYRQWKDHYKRFLEDKNGKTVSAKDIESNEKTERNKTIERWITAEKQYAKRQITWFNKDKRINWFDIMKGRDKERIEKFVPRWYFRSKDVSKKN